MAIVAAPASLVAEPIRKLVGFGIAKVPNPMRIYHHSGGMRHATELPPGSASGLYYGVSTVVTGGMARRQAIIELDHKVKHGICVRQLYLAHEERGHITKIEDVTLRYSDLDSKITKAIRPVAPSPSSTGIVCSIRLLAMPPWDRKKPGAQSTPLLLVIDEALDRLVLAIGNVGDRIEWNPNAPPGYKPDWFHRLEIKS